VVVHGERHREPLGTTDWRQARDLEKKRIAELQKRPPDPTKRPRAFSALSVDAAITVYADERRSQVSERMVAWWKEMGRPLAAFFENKPIRKISPADLMAYQKRASRSRARTKDRQQRTVRAPTDLETRQTVVPLLRRLQAAQEHQTAGGPSPHRSGSSAPV
jgi:hypothetical protein